MKTINVALVCTDDYEAVYFNGELKASESMFHTSSLGELFVGYAIESFNSFHVSQESLDEHNGGDFPSKFSELVLED